MPWKFRDISNGSELLCWQTDKQTDKHTNGQYYPRCAGDIVNTCPEIGNNDAEIGSTVYHRMQLTWPDLWDNYTIYHHVDKQANNALKQSW